MKSRPSSSSKIFCALSVRGRKDGEGSQDAAAADANDDARRGGRSVAPQKCATASVGGVFGARDGAKRGASFLEQIRSSNKSNTS